MTSYKPCIIAHHFCEETHTTELKEIGSDWIEQINLLGWRKAFISRFVKKF